MIRARSLLNIYQKRLIRPLYAQTQATPYSCVLDPSLFNSDGSFRPPLSTDTLPIARSANAYTLQGGLVPGTVMIKGAGEGVVVATGANTASVPFGLLANFVGGTLDDLTGVGGVGGGGTEIGVWRGPDSVFELLAPAYDDTGLAAAYSAAGPGTPVKLFAGPDGRLTATSPGGNATQVAWLIDRPSSTRIVINVVV